MNLPGQEKTDRGGGEKQGLLLFIEKSHPQFNQNEPLFQIRFLLLGNTRKALSVLLSHPFFPIFLLQCGAYPIEQHGVHSENPICSSARESLGGKCYGNTPWERGGRKEGREMYCSHHQIHTARLTHAHRQHNALQRPSKKRKTKRAFQKTNTETNQMRDIIFLSSSLQQWCFLSWFQCHAITAKIFISNSSS